MIIISLLTNKLDRDQVVELFSARKLGVFERADGQVVMEGLPSHRFSTLESFQRLLRSCFANAHLKYAFYVIHLKCIILFIYYYVFIYRSSVFTSTVFFIGNFEDV